MPIIIVKRDLLYQSLGESYTEDDFQKLLFEYGVELDDVTSERKMKEKEFGGKLENSEKYSDEVLYKIELPANRYDILCEEGIVQALKIFLGKMSLPEYRYVPPQPQLVITVKKECKQIRPFVVCAALRNVKLTDHVFEFNFLKLQEKLHQNIGRRRTLVAIGTHDLDTLTPPFTYEALPPQDISFIPLEQQKEFQADELMEFYETEPSVKHLKPYVPIIKESPVYPVIYDSKRVVLSLPPIINGDHSKMSSETKNIFIECTCTDHTKGEIVLQTIVALFSQYCAEPFTIEPVKVVYEEEDGSKREEITPNLKKKEFICSVKEMTDLIGVDLDMQTSQKMLKRMQLDSVKVDEDKMKVVVPITRNDILQQCDIAEDLAIGYGYNNIKVTQPKSQTIGKEVPLNRLTDNLRQELSTCGYTEMYTLSLISKVDNFDLMNLKRHPCVELGNSKAKVFQMIRTSLIPCMLRALEYNQKRIPLPILFFEINDVAFLSPLTDTGSMNERRLCVGYLAKVSKLEFIHGTLDRVMEMIEVPYGKDKGGYYLREADHPSFFKGRHADVMFGEIKIGDFGIIHPSVLKNFGVELPISILEINIEIFVKDSKMKSLFKKN